MPIEFACPSCHRRYRVTDELAGKNAKCGKCGHRMPIPKFAAAPKPAAAKPATPKPATSKRAASATPIAGVGSWLNDELEASQSTIVKPPAGAVCPGCGKPLAHAAVLCVACGYDTRTRKKLETKHEIDDTEVGKAATKKHSKLGSAASLLRGTVFSFLGAMLGALTWAVFVYLTHWESGYIALGLGGLAGFGMALGHDDDDGTLAGIIAAFMSLVGIVAAKIFIIVIFIAAFLASVVQEADPVAMKRKLMVHNVAGEKLRAQGVDPFGASNDQWEHAQAEAEAELAELSDEELEARWEKLLAAEEAGQGRDEWHERVDKGPADDDADWPGADLDAHLPAVAIEEEPSAIGLFFKLMFSPIDGIFILLAFFTAYKVGSGQMTD